MRPYAHPRVVTGGFVAAVMAVVIAIIVTTPEYAIPVESASDGPTRAATAPRSVLPATASEAEVSEATGSRPPEELSGYRWPLKGGRIMGWYEPSKTGFFEGDDGAMHEGLDISWSCGAAVLAAHRGRVVAAGRDFVGAVGFDASRRQIKRFYRKLGPRRVKELLPIAVVIDDGNGYRSAYKHLDGVAVKVGDKVRAGGVIGSVGQSGGVARCHLQYELIRMDGEWVRVAKSWVRKVGYPKWTRERVDPLLVLKLGAKPGPQVVKRFPPPEGAPGT